MQAKDDKVVSMEIIDGELIIAVDSNKDGQPVLKLTIDLLEVPEEILQAIKKKKD